MRHKLLYFALALCIIVLPRMQAYAQGNELYINGGQVYLVGGVTVTVQGKTTVTDNAGNNGLLLLTNATDRIDMLTTGASYKGDFQMSGASSVLNNTGKVAVDRHFYHDAGTVTSNAGSYLYFNGSESGTYEKGTGITDANSDFTNVEINKTGGSFITLKEAGGSMQDGNLIITNNLNFVSGFIKTHSSVEPSTVSSPRVDVRYTGSSGISGHNTTPASSASVGHVYGNLRRYVGDGASTTYDFPVGSSTSEQLLRLAFGATDFYLAANNNTGVAMGYIDVVYKPSSVDGSSPTVSGQCGSATIVTGWQGRWDYTPKNTAGATITSLSGGKTYRPSLHPRPTQTTPGTAPHAILISHDGAATWNVLKTTTLEVGGYACHQSTNWYDLTTTAVNISQFSSAKGGSSNVPFPVEGLTFRATPLVNSIMLDWQTQKEINNSHFDLERSLDQTNFEVIKAGIPGHGTTDSPKSYAQEDKEVEFNTTYYYRLHQFDFDGNASYSEIREAILRADAKTTVSFYPNPTQGELSLQVNLATDSKLNVRFFDAIGKEVRIMDYDLTMGTHILDMSSQVSNLASGAYTAVVRTNSDVFTHKLVKSK